MRKTIVILVLAVAVASVFTSCSTTRNSRTGCGMNQGYIGYGNGHVAR